MSDVETLNAMIKKSATIPLNFASKKPSVELNEPQCRDRDCSVVIKNIPATSIVIKVDAFRSPDTIFANTKSECKRADYVIISEDDDPKKNCILYVELKNTRSQREEVIQQLRGAKCFVSYCGAVGRHFWGKSNFLENFQERFVAIAHISLAKRRTRETHPEGKHDAPEKFLKIDWPQRLEFNKLIGS